MHIVYRISLNYVPLQNFKNKLQSIPILCSKLLKLIMNLIVEFTQNLRNTSHMR